MNDISVIEKGGGVDGLVKAMRDLAKMQLLVGIPSDDEPNLGDGSGSNVRNDGPATNALIAYVAENGSPARNIPARPFLVPGVEAGMPQAEPYLKAAAEAAISGSTGAVERNLMAAGLVLQGAVRQEITTGDFAPLAPSTVAARRRRGHQGEIRPLLDSGQLRAAVNFLVRKGDQGT